MQFTEHKKIVVVDDNVEILGVLRDLLEDEGYDVVSFTSAEDVMHVAHELHARLFLLDLMLPGRNGIELARELRSSSFVSSSLIAMTASEHMARLAEESGLFNLVFSKPFDLMRILLEIHQHAA